jgi:hypothetical protein
MSDASDSIKLMGEFNNCSKSSLMMSDLERIVFTLIGDRKRFIVSQGMLRMIIGDYKEAIFVLLTGSIRKKISSFL